MKVCLITVILFGFVHTSEAFEAENMYTKEQLAEWQGNSKRSFPALFSALVEGVPQVGNPAAVSQPHREIARSISLAFPMPDEIDPVTKEPIGTNPLAYFARIHSQEIVLPALSLRFIADMCVSFVHLTMVGDGQEKPTIYLKLLKYNQVSRWPDGRYLNPLEAMSISEMNRWHQNTRPLYLRCYNDIRSFILLHEIGHFVLGHGGDDRIPSSQAQLEETSADRFALDGFKRIGVVPAGLGAYFITVSELQVNRSDFASKEEWENRLVRRSTHPISAARLKDVAEYLIEHRREFAIGHSDLAVGEKMVVEIAKSYERLAILANSAENNMRPAQGERVDLGPLGLK